MPNQFVCDMTALSSEQRSRHQELANFLRSSLHAIQELSTGYEFEFSYDAATYQAITELTPLEHACCPFFKIGIRLEPEGRLFLELTGSEGVKPFIRMEFAHLFNK